MTGSHWSILFSFVICGLIVPAYSVQAKPLKILGLFDKSSAQLKHIFSTAILAANDQRDRESLQGLTLDVDAVTNVYKKSKQLCKILESGVVAVVALHKANKQDYARSICDLVDIPLIDIGWINHINEETITFLSLHPDADMFVTAFYNLVDYWKWPSFVLLYEQSEDLVKYQKFFTNITSFEVTMRQLENDYYHPILREIKAGGETRIILDCSATTVKKILLQAQQLRLTAPGFHYLLTTLDVHRLDLTTFVHDEAKITAFQLIDLNATLAYSDLNKKHHAALSTTDGKMTTEEALLFDSVTLLSAAFKKMDPGSLQDHSVSCETADSWVQGSLVFNAISNTQIEGLTGNVIFDGRGVRSDFYMDIVQVKDTGVQIVGTWSTKDRVKMAPTVTVLVSSAIRGKSLDAITTIEEPYVMKHKDFESRFGNERYEGYAVDLMNRIAELLQFNYTLRIMNTHGVKHQQTKQWNGLIGELIAKKSDIAIGGITISHQREDVVDFTKPFMHLGISILYRKPAPQPPDLFSFLHPFTREVWQYIIMAFMLVSLVTFLLARFTPYEWYNPHPCDVHMDVVENQFTIGNCLWFTVGSLMQQGSDVSPRAVSTRMLGGCWWFFTLIMIASYTANLAAFLAVERTDQPIKGPDDLIKQSDIKYGCYKGGATYDFFNGTRHPVYQEMWKAMIQDENNFVDKTDKGVERVRKDKNYAFLMETPSLEYNVNKYCELTQLGGLLDSKGFGFATQQSSPYRDEISKAILRLQENSELEVLKDKWWKRNSGVCEVNKAAETNPLGMKNVGGVFVILLGGIIVSFLLATMELLFSVRKVTRITKRPFCAEVSRAFVYALKMKGSSPLKLTKHQRLCL